MADSGAMSDSGASPPLADSGASPPSATSPAKADSGASPAVHAYAGVGALQGAKTGGPHPRRGGEGGRGKNNVAYKTKMTPAKEDTLVKGVS